MYSASVVVTGKALNFQPYLARETSRIAHVLDDDCSDLLVHREAELRFFAMSRARSWPGNVDAYAVQHLPSHTVCLVFHQF